MQLGRTVWTCVFGKIVLAVFCRFVGIEYVCRGYLVVSRGTFMLQC